MLEKSIHFFSDGIKLRGTLYFPDEYVKGKDSPVIVACSGYTGLNAIYPRLFAQALTKEAYAVMGFDYRGCGESAGTRGKLLLEDQVHDIQNALVFLRQCAEVDKQRIGLLGWGMGAGLVIAAAARSDVAGVAALNGFFDGKKMLQYFFPGEKFTALLDKIAHDKVKRVMTGKSTYGNPFLAYPLDPETEHVVDDRLRPVKNYNTPVAFDIAESILTFNALPAAETLSCPVFVGHGKDNKLHPVEQSQAVYDRVTSPKEFFTIEGKHNDFMQIEHPEFQRLVEKLKGWFGTVFYPTDTQ